MSAWTMGARGLDKRGSFFKLIDTIASEIGELKREMVQTDISLENGLEPSETYRTGKLSVPCHSDGKSNTADLQCMK